MTEAKNGRDESGRFEKGRSGCPTGRPRASTRIPHPEQFRDEVFAIAEFKIPTTLGGKATKLSLYEAAVLKLGIKAAEGDMRAAEKFLDIVHAQIEQELRFMRDEQKNLKGAEATWLHEPDEKKAAYQREVFNYAMAVSRGRRERTTPAFPPPKRKR